MNGLVSLVGAGPGAADLLTLRAVQRLQAADAVVYDRLISPQVLEYAPACAMRFDRGDCKQAEINALLVRLGRSGLRVVRLKGGDPFVFGRGGEEMLALADAGIPYEVVPGLSATLAAPAVAGIPLTHRGVAHTFTVTTATGREGADLEEAELAALGTPGGTLVIVMTVERLARIVDGLLRYGRSPHETAAVVQHATWPTQMVVAAPLGEIVDRAREASVCPPAVLVVGPTVGLITRETPNGGCEP